MSDKLKSLLQTQPLILPKLQLGVTGDSEKKLTVLTV
jgi:hypothetical protein